LCVGLVVGVCGGGLLLLWGGLWGGGGDVYTRVY